jgi:hypothetical protein
MNKRLSLKSKIKKMNITVTGKIEQKGFGFGVWALVAKDGTTYELKEPPSELEKELSSVTIQGVIRDDIMTMADIGPVLEIKSFSIN